MDNGQTGQTNDYLEGQDFFTAGPGTVSESVNNVEPENNLDLSNEAISWADATPRHDHRKIGNSATHSATEHPIITSVEHDPRAIGHMATEYAPQAIGASPELGEVVSLEMPPDSANHEPAPTASGNVDDISAIDFAAIRAQKDNISPETLKITQHAVSEFERGKITPAELDDLRWESTKAYVKNSFGRDLAT